MLMISDKTSGISPLSKAADTEEISSVRQMEEKPLKKSYKPVKDEYVPEEKEKSIGRYWLGKGEDDQPKIYFDDPGEAKKAEKTSGEIPSGERVPDEKSEICRGSTDKVDREIEELKRKIEELKRQIGSEKEETKRR